MKSGLVVVKGWAGAGVTASRQGISFQDEENGCDLGRGDGCLY